jgi:hypothetical protein
MSGLPAQKVAVAMCLIQAMKMSSAFQVGLASRSHHDFASCCTATKIASCQRQKSLFATKASFFSILRAQHGQGQVYDPVVVNTKRGESIRILNPQWKGESQKGDIQLASTMGMQPLK